MLDGAPSDMSLKLALCMAVIPIILLVIAFVISHKKNKIDEDEYDRMLKVIEERKAEKATE